MFESQTEHVWRVFTVLRDVLSGNGGTRERDNDDWLFFRTGCYDEEKSVRWRGIESSQRIRNHAGDTNRIQKTLPVESAWTSFREAIHPRSGMMIAVTVLTMVVLSTALPVVGGTASTSEYISPEDPESIIQARNTTVTSEEALSAKERAKRLYNQLKELNSREEINIDSNLLQSIKYHLNKGNLAFQTNEYGAAKKQYEIATDQARTGLKKAYREGSQTLLNGSMAHLNAREELGYSTSKMGMLTARIDKRRSELVDATTLSAIRDQYRAARELQADVEALPAPWIIQIVSFVTSIWLLLPVVVILAGGGVLWYRRFESEDSSAETDLH